ncbi:aquaporin [Macroventuria anomochaeta]|uniref:Aquaporin n=1 Tax=Macroventuria anomochaeta TaxID=301207 RepID=A0ACB6SHF8_9PLEO|nr:aquaporin [Macroventuria anomochaeta]KAF2632527.1 aquaporin [Macroventuria anomochaeta]
MKPTYTEDPNRPGERRALGWLPNRTRHLLIAFLGEFIGTFLFLFFAFAATQTANNLLGNRAMDIQSLMYISLAFGFSLAVNVWVFFRVSGGLFNPAVTVAMALIGALPWLKAALLILAQLLGAITAAGVVAATFPGPLAVRTRLGAGTSISRGVFIEMFLTAMLIFCIFMLAAEKHRSTFIAPIGIGLALFIAEMAGVLYTGGSLNPARSFGPDVATKRFDGYHWIYWVGPLLGALLAVLLYRLLKMLEYETANPGADGDGRHEAYYEHSGSSDHYQERVPTTRGHGATDGTSDGMDFASHIRTAKHGPHHNAALTHTQTDSAAMSEPMPAFHPGHDGHHSQIMSDRSYRSGPSVESGSS